MFVLIVNGIFLSAWLYDSNWLCNDLRASERASELLGGGAVSCWVYRLRAAAAAVSNAVIPGSESLNTLGRNLAAAERARAGRE